MLNCDTKHVIVMNNYSFLWKSSHRINVRVAISFIQALSVRFIVTCLFNLESRSNSLTQIKNTGSQ